MRGRLKHEKAKFTLVCVHPHVTAGRVGFETKVETASQISPHDVYVHVY